MGIRIAFVSDIHSGPETVECRPGKEALPLLRQFSEEVRSMKADIVIDLGDRINNTSHDADLENLKAVAAEFRTMAVPSYHVIGNHDVHFISPDENMAVLALPGLYYSVSFRGFRLIFLDTAELLKGGMGGISDEQKEWLADELSRADGFPLIFSHHPLCIQDQRGNPFFVSDPDGYSVAGREDLTALISKSKAICFSGHTHWMYTCVEDNVPFLSLPSLLESYPVKEGAPGRFCIADIDEDGTVNLSEEMLRPRRTLGRHFIPSML